MPSGEGATLKRDALLRATDAELFLDAARSLEAFTAAATGFLPARHHRIVIENLKKVAAGDCDRLMICMPPGHAKTTLVSMSFTAWYLATKKNTPAIIASHTHELAAHIGRRIRNTFLRADIRDLYGVTVADDSSSAARFTISNGSDLFAVGVGGAVTGRRAKIAIIDDPLRGVEDADSERVRDRIYEWYRADLETRLLPGAAVILILTRWNEDDLAGRLLKSERDRWTLVNMPAINEDGAPLWPEMYDIAHLSRIRNTTPGRIWSALYQQQPTPEEGVFFVSSMIHFYANLPEHVSYYLASDFALTENGGDWTVHVVGAFDGAILYIHDLYRARKTLDVTVSAKLDLAIRYNVSGDIGETGVIEKAAAPMIRSMSAQRGVEMSRRLLPTIGDKAARARTLQGLMGMGRVKIRGDQTWTDVLVSELLSFQAGGSTDDQVDALALLARAVNEMTPPSHGNEKSVYGDFYEHGGAQSWMS